VNHRTGLFDAVLIKENHIRSAGGIGAALSAVAGLGLAPEVVVEIEVESLVELTEALDAGARRILLDNFTLHDLRAAVELNSRYGEKAAELEASGNVTVGSVREIAETGVDYISTGAITKNIAAADLSMLFRIGHG
jgi:nicotinate-nucleotide pyrophosphorylase (carboxylating)